MVYTRLAITYAVDVLSRFLSNPSKKYWNTIKWIMRYLKGTSNLSLFFFNGKPLLVVYTDANMGRNIDTCKFTSRYLITFVSEDVAW